MFGCGCCPTCAIYADLFAVDSLASSWGETAGTWSITGGVLQTTDADAILIATALHPDGDDAPQYVGAKIRMAAALDRARLIIAWKDSSNYLFAEFWITGGCIHVQPYKRVSGTNTALGDELLAPFAASTSTFYVSSLCYKPGEDAKLTVRIIEPFGPVWSEEVDVSGTFGNRGGVGTGNPVDNTIRFDDFSYQKLYDEEERPICVECDRLSYESCFLYNDTFFRSNSTNIGCAWEEVAGDWSISSNKLVITAADALAIHRGKHPSKLNEANFRFAFSADTGGIVHFILDYIDDQNFFFIKIEPGSHGLSGQVSFWRKEAGTDTQLGESTRMLMTAGLSNLHEFAFCVQDDRIVLELESAAQSTFHGTLGFTQLAEDPRFGFGTGSSSEVRFTLFDIQLLANGAGGGFGCGDCGFVPCLRYNGDPRSSTTLGATGQWDVSSGTWGYNTATTAQKRYVGGAGTWHTASSDAMVICKVANSLMGYSDGLPDLTCKLSVDVSTFGFENVLRAIIGWQDDSNYLFAEVEYSAEGYDVGYLRIGKVVGGSRTVIEEKQLGVWASKPNADVVSNSFLRQGVSVINICYDGLLLRASYTSQTVIYHGDPALVLASVGANTTETVRGDAGTGWIPGYFGVATGTMASDVAVFGNIRYWHDLQAGVGDLGGCAYCSTTEPLCRFCFTTESGEKVDKTPNALLITLAGISSSGGTSDCSNIGNYNDTFAVPFYTDDYGFGDDGVGNCFWQVSGGDNCNHPNVDYILDEIIIRLRGWTNGTDVGFEIRAQLIMYSDIFGFSGSSSGQITWTEIILDSEMPSYDEDFPSINCMEVLEDWIALNDTTVKGGWATTMPGTPTASVKIA